MEEFNLSHQSSPQQKSTSQPQSLSPAYRQRVTTKPVDIAGIQRSVSEMFVDSSVNYTYSRSLPTQGNLKVCSPARIPGAPLFKSRPPPCEADSIPPLSLPPASSFNSGFEDVGQGISTIQYASSCPASIWHFEDFRPSRYSITDREPLASFPESDETEFERRNSESLTALSILEGWEDESRRGSEAEERFSVNEDPFVFDLADHDEESELLACHDDI